MLLNSRHCLAGTEEFMAFVHCLTDLAFLAVTEYSLYEHKQATVALRQLEECGVPCECPRCKSAYHRLMSIQRQMEEREQRFARPLRRYIQCD